MDEDIISDRLFKLSDDLMKYNDLLEDIEFQHSKQDILNIISNIKSEMLSLKEELQNV